MTRPRHRAGFAAAALAGADAGLAYALKDSAAFLFWLLPCALLAALFALGFWAAPNNLEPLLRQQYTKIMIWVVGAVTIFAAIVAITRMMRS